MKPKRLKVKATKNVNPFWKRDGFASQIEYLAAKKGELLKLIVDFPRKNHRLYEEAKLARAAKLI